MKLIVQLIFIIALFYCLLTMPSCVSVKHDYSRQAMVIDIDTVTKRNYRLVMIAGRDTVYYSIGLRGGGKRYDFGRYYTVYFIGNTIVKINKNH